MIVSALANEVRTADAQAWLQAQPADTVLMSEWTITEFSSALALKMRTGVFDAQSRAAALAAFQALVLPSVRVVAISGATFRRAAGMIDQSAIGLRAADALHLAVAVEQGATLWTLDQGMAAAGAQLGVATQRL